MNPIADPPKSNVALEIAGSNTFGRNPKISSSQSYNMFISDNWAVSTPGYKRILNLLGGSAGRGIYASSSGDFMISVIANGVFRISGDSTHLNSQRIFSLDTSFGDVSIAENIAFQIAICDGQDLWIYDRRSNIAQKAALPINTQTGLEITPGYVTYHDGYFIVPDITSSAWYLSPLNNGLGNWNYNAGFPVSSAIQTKATPAVAVLRAPGKGNLIYVFGKDVMELWQNVGSQFFPYQRTSSMSVDYGCLSSNTIGAMDEYVAWLGINEKSGPVIMVSTGGQFTRLSTDGIDFKLANLVNPSLSTGFFYKTDGHVLYQITFYDPRDNMTLIYDFNTQKFFYLTREDMNFHIASQVCSFNNTYYFVSLLDGNLYELNSDYTTYDYSNPETDEINEYEIPRVRICNTLRQDDASRFIIDNISFTIEQGEDEDYPGSILYFLTTEDGRALTSETNAGYIGSYLTTEQVTNPYVPRVDLSISNDGGQTFSSAVTKELNTQGIRKNRVIFWKLGLSNEFVVQLKFWSKARITVSDGIVQTRGLVVGAA